ncbi:MAG: hypothetical protein CMJ18_00495 [Phycisphaeraceae bacterium]|nr:hypothetical protein [Phycisphaeraceae bacterium]
MTWDPHRLDPRWPFDLTRTTFDLDAGSTALLVIDMQVDQITIGPESPMAERHPQIRDDWERRIGECVIPNIERLIDWFRRRDHRIVYTRNGTMTATGDEMTRRLKPRRPVGGQPIHRNSPGYQVVERLAPRNEDMVVDKLTSGAFTASTLDHALRNMRISGLVMTGVLTDACVFGTARSAAELGYDSLICEDACATFTRRAHDDALMMHARIFGRVDTTDGVLAELEKNHG